MQDQNLVSTESEVRSGNNFRGGPPTYAKMSTVYNMVYVLNNRSAVHECKGLGALRLLMSTIKPVVRYLQYTVSRNRVDLCLHGNGDLRMCGSQTDRSTARILVFLDDLLIFY